MNTSSELTASGWSHLRLSDLAIADTALAAARLELYHSSNPGFIVIPGFIDSAMLAHMRKIWSECVPDVSHAAFPGKQHIYLGCPDYFVGDAAHSRTFYNFHWNAPLDEVTATVSMYIHVLRNRLAGRAPFSEVVPATVKACSYRVAISRETKTWIAPHRDYFDENNKHDKLKYDLSRLQATLFLSNKGEDYDGVGFKFETNGGRTVVFGTDVAVSAGDLVIWRYNNLHSVEDVHTRPDQLGFMRIIHPFETLAAQPSAPAGTAHGQAGSALRALAKRVRRGLNR